MRLQLCEIVLHFEFHCITPLPNYPLLKWLSEAPNCDRQKIKDEPKKFASWIKVIIFPNFSKRLKYVNLMHHYNQNLVHKNDDTSIIKVCLHTGKNEYI